MYGNVVKSSNVPIKLSEQGSNFSMEERQKVPIFL